MARASRLQNLPGLQRTLSARTQNKTVLLEIVPPEGESVRALDSPNVETELIAVGGVVRSVHS